MSYKVEMIPIGDIYIDLELNDARGKILPIDVVDLARDIKSTGLQQPLHVQRWDKQPGYKFRCVAGNRRLTALKVAEFKEAPCFVVPDGMTDLQVRSMNFKENMLRKNLDTIQQCIGIRPYIVAGWNDQEIATEFQQSRGWVQVRRVVLSLPQDLQEDLRADLLSQQQILQLGRLRTRDEQYAFVKAAKEHHHRGEKMVSKPLPKAIKPEDRKWRRPEEIIEMISYMIIMLDESNLATKALAWAAGTYSDIEFGVDLREYCKDHCVEFYPFDRVSSVLS